MKRLEQAKRRQYIFPVLHGIVCADELLAAPELHEYVSKLIHRQSTDASHEIVSDIIRVFGVREDAFVPLLRLPLMIGRFPVTNLEYRRFIRAGGYSKQGIREYWSDEGRDFWLHYAARRPHHHFGRIGEGNTIRTEDASINENLSASNLLFNHFAQPVTGVSYFEAEAYCKWLGTTGSLSSVNARLPTQDEWLLAARRESDLYPWGNEWPTPQRINNEWPTPQRINIVDKVLPADDNLELDKVDLEDLGRISTPSIFGEYPDGVSPVGCHDMFGNVWEWLGDWLTPDEAVSKEDANNDEFNRAKIAGNCCFDPASRIERLPIAYRRPGYRHHVIGFRIVCQER